MSAGIDQLVADMSRYALTSEEFEHTFVRLEQISRLPAAGRLDAISAAPTPAGAAVRAPAATGGRARFT